MWSGLVLSSSSLPLLCSRIAQPPPWFENSQRMPLIIFFCVASFEKRRCCGADGSVTQDSTAGGEPGQTAGAVLRRYGGVKE